MSIRAQDYEQMLATIRGLQTQVQLLSAQKASLPGGGRFLAVRPARVAAVNDDGTYNVKILTSVDLLETNWIINNAISSSPDVTHGVDDYVSIAINGTSPHYLLSGGGGGSVVAYLVPHGHRGPYDGGYGNFLSGNR